MPALPLPSQNVRDRLRRASASLDLAETTGSPFAMSQALAEVARCHREMQAAASAESHFEAAVRWARFTGSNDHVADLLCELADASVRVALARDLAAMLARVAEDDEPGARQAGGHSGGAAWGRAARERARDHAFEASQLAGRVSDPACEAHLLLRASAVLERCGDHADAAQMQRRALDLLGGATPREAAQVTGLGRLADV
ncbi:MAG: hypothetical protein IT499_07760 [Rubrivivax sp.]|nr:hypothetical protein [Rubrivivax sp.]MCL4695919.1 hypothetical protein [Burkholderiaceae bacterium]